MRNYKGFFITFESTKEGLGKTSQAGLLAEHLKRAGYDVVLTREPGGTRLGQHIRRLLLDSTEELSKATELFLFMADRSQHYKEVLKPALKDGKIVICDRYFDSTLVYQGSGRGWKSAFLLRLHQASTGSLTPDLTFVLDGQPHVQRSSEDRIENAGDKFHERMARGMHHLLAKNHRNRYESVEANRPKLELAESILNLAQKHMADRKLPKQL